MLFQKEYPAPPIDRREILRYAGAKEERPEITPLLEEALKEALPLLSYRVVYTILPVKITCEAAELGTLSLPSRDLVKSLSGCDRAILFAATLGLSFDRLIQKYTRLSPAKAVLLQGIGAERIESLCNAFQDEAAITYGAARTRFSPGYGDLPLTFQKEMFSLLDCPRKIGLTLNESLLMSPTKSVTAIIGIPQNTECAVHAAHSCDTCHLTDCQFRK